MEPLQLGGQPVPAKRACAALDAADQETDGVGSDGGQGWTTVVSVGQYTLDRSPPLNPVTSTSPGTSSPRLPEPGDDADRDQIRTGDDRVWQRAGVQDVVGRGGVARWAGGVAGDLGGGCGDPRIPVADAGMGGRGGVGCRVL